MTFSGTPLSAALLFPTYLPFSRLIMIDKVRLKASSNSHYTVLSFSLEQVNNLFSLCHDLHFCTFVLPLAHKVLP